MENTSNTEICCILPCGKDAGSVQSMDRVSLPPMPEGSVPGLHTEEQKLGRVITILDVFDEDRRRRQVL